LFFGKNDVCAYCSLWKGCQLIVRKPGNYRIYLCCGNVAIAAALLLVFCCLQRCDWRQSHQNGYYSCYLSNTIVFHILVLAEALLRHTKARDVFHCLGLYPETA
jgi:hypothetical protein